MRAVSEKIDERILRLLGLEDTFDIDYDTYLTLLKEAIVVGKNKLPEDELSLLANERKRIRGKKGRFKPKKEKITAGKVATIKFLKPSKKSFILPAEISKPSIDNQQDLISIRKPLESIAKTLTDFLNFRRKTREEDRKEKETQKRTKREEGLEGFKKGVSAVSGAAKKMLAPFQSIIDRIWRFIFFTLLGRAFTQLMNWLGDPANKKKIEVLGRFLKDWWPTLLGAAVLFFTPFGKFVRSTLKLVGFFAGKLVKAIPKIANAIKGLGKFAVGHPLLTIGAITGVSAAVGAAKERERMENIAARQGTTLPKRGEEKGILNTIGAGFASLGQLGSSGFAGLARGGSVPNLQFGYDGITKGTGQKITGFGLDTQLIAARPGEIVMNKETVDAVGADNLLALNRQYGGPGANKPKIGRLFNFGGIVQKYQNGGMVGGDPKEEDIMKHAHSSTVRIETAGPAGSGVLVKNNNGEYTVLSAGHVIKNSSLGEEITIITSDGKRHNIIRDEKNSQLIEGSDMGSLKFKSAENYMVARQGDPSRLKPGDKTYVGGFPINPTGQDQTLRFTRGQVINPKNTTKDDVRDGYTLAYTNQTQGGMSGGFLYNSRGELIGIHGRGSEEGVTQGSRAMPISYYPGGFGSTDTRKPYTNPNLVFQTLSQEQQENAAKIYQESTGKKSDPGGIPGKQTVVGTREQVKTRMKQPFQGGGLIKENTGRNIIGATADRQLTALQPGEFVIPKDSVDRLGTTFFEKLVAMTDSNSNAYLGRGTVRRPQITPLPKGLFDSVQTISSGGGSMPSMGGIGGSAAGSKVPVFSAIPESGVSVRQKYLETYGVGAG